MTARSGAQRWRFYDGGLTDEPPDPGHAPRILLERVLEDGVESFRMLRRVAYLDEQVGEILVPRDLDTFRTDLTSVPSLLTWLVPRTGRHLPAALVHDALVERDGPQPAYLAAHEVDRVTADRVFRTAMRDTGTRPVRRWLAWAGVTLATVRAGSSSWTPARHAAYAVAVVATLLVITGLGVLALLDLADVVAVVPWMGERPWWRELIGGAAGASSVPVLLALTWGRLWRAGAIVGVSLAALLPVTAAVALLTLLYRLLEAAVERAPRVVAGLAAAGLAVSAVLVLVLSSG